MIGGYFKTITTTIYFENQLKPTDQSYYESPRFFSTIQHVFFLHCKDCVVSLHADNLDNSLDHEI